MKFIPKELHGNVNIPAVSPLREFFRAAVKLLGIVLGVYILLGFAVDLISPRISINTELKLGRLFSSKFAGRERSGTEKKLQIILDGLARNADSLPAFPYKVYVQNSKESNAFAYPGGVIVVLDPILQAVHSENEIAMVLAHELGHYYYRDHLRGMGRGLVFLMISSALLGADSSASKLISNAVSNTEMRFSQHKEQRADLYALELLNKTYGNAAGAVDFLETMAKKYRLFRFLYIFSTHPYPPSRIAAIRERIRIKGYAIGRKIPLITGNAPGRSS